MLAIQLVCHSIYMSVCVLLALRLFTSAWQRRGSQTALLLTGWKAFPVSVEGQLCALKRGVCTTSKHVLILVWVLRLAAAAE